MSVCVLQLFIFFLHIVDDGFGTKRSSGVVLIASEINCFFVDVLTLPSDDFRFSGNLNENIVGTEFGFKLRFGFVHISSALKSRKKQSGSKCSEQIRKSFNLLQSFRFYKMQPTILIHVWEAMKASLPIRIA